MQISVITIIFNDKAHILETMDSVLGQSHENIQYIIIDGASTDGSSEVIEQRIREVGEIVEDSRSDLGLPRGLAAQDSQDSTDLAAARDSRDSQDSLASQKDSQPSRRFLRAKKRDNAGFEIIYLREKDGGIYEAMNKGVDLASGAWCSFMNSGDKFFQNDTLERVLAATAAAPSGENGGGANGKNGGATPAVIYGNAQRVYDKENQKILRSSHNHRFRHCFVHQSALIDTKVMKKYKYDCSFKIAGDADFFSKIYNLGLPFRYVDVVVSSIDNNGISSQMHTQAAKELYAIGIKAHKLYPLYHIIILVRCWAKHLILFVLDSLPRKWRNKVLLMLSRSKL